MLVGISMRAVRYDHDEGGNTYDVRSGWGRDLQKAEEITEVASTMYEGEGEFQKTETFEDIICVCP